MSVSPFSQKKLWKKLTKQKKLQTAIIDLREIATVISAKTSEVMPQYTDHSVKHMDELWDVCERVFTEAEISKFSESEAFVLACSFYTHDLAMAILATSEGEIKAKATTAYNASYSKLKLQGYPEEYANGIALKISVRELHGDFVTLFTEGQIPGLSRYLIEQSEIRSAWGRFISDVSASHNWSIQKLDKVLGARGKVPDPLGATIDLGFLGCALRVIDYAHINYKRASSLERMLRGEMPYESMKHWLAQEQITGPVREANNLVFGAMRPINDINAWWTFYEMAIGLDREISSVQEYLSSRSCSVGRFTLDGVKGVKAPHSFSSYIIPEGFEPVDLQFRPDSMDRLVSLLGGKQLYGKDVHASLRELLQNASDAIMLRSKVEEEATGIAVQGEIHVVIQDENNSRVLTVSDNGIGMSEGVITKYLLGIASDYWHSSDFMNDFPDANTLGFHPVGRFGIGFLSVFMVGDDVQVKTQRRNHHSFELHLTGVGKRGSLYRKPSTFGNGTSVTVKITKMEPQLWDNIPAIIRTRAPMLPIPITTAVNGVVTVIPPMWWRSLPQTDFYDFVSSGMNYMHKTTDVDKPYFHSSMRGETTFCELNPLEKWPDKQPEIMSSNYRILGLPLASKIIICSKGFMVNTIAIPGLTGVVDVGESDINASRNNLLSANIDEMKKEFIAKMNDEVVSALNRIADEVNIPARFDFLHNVAKKYGNEVLLRTKLPWITSVIPPGESKLNSPEGVFKQLVEKKECIIAFGEGVNPWNVFSLCKARYTELPNDSLIFPVPNSDDRTPGSYEDKNEEFRGKLADHFFNYGANHSDARLLHSMLDLISRAWGISSEVLLNYEWLRKKRRIYAYLKYRELV